MKLFEYLGKDKSKRFNIAACFLLVVLISFLDYLTGLEIGFSVFYLFPISLITWFAGIWSGVVISLVSSAVWLITDLMKAKTYASWFTPYWNAFVRLIFFLVIIFLIDTLKKEYFRSRVDSLTKIGNRRFFFETIGMELIRARRYKRPFTVAYIDIDNFKTVNDNFGHMGGDKLLISVAKVIKNNIRALDRVARLGGDEFVILLPETGIEAAPKVLKKLKGKLLTAMNQNKWPVTFSIGVVTFVNPPDSCDEVVSQADNVMYSVKESGKNSMKFEIFNG